MINKGSGFRIRDSEKKLFVFFWFLVLPIFLSFSANSSPVVADLSNYQIAMDSSFNGTRLFLFGTRNDSGDIVVVIRGEDKNYMVRKKEQVAGVWVNNERMKFYGVPSFYAVASSKPLTAIGENSLFSKLNIGEKFLLTMPEGVSSVEKFDEFGGAFLSHQQEKNLYYTSPENIGFVGETLFKSVIEFSDNIPVGNYTAEIYLISDGEILGMQSIPITVAKSGVDAIIYNYAHNFPALYGFSAIVLAVFAGWFSGRLFEARA